MVISMALWPTISMTTRGWVPSVSSSETQVWRSPELAEHAGEVARFEWMRQRLPKMWPVSPGGSGSGEAQVLVSWCSWG
jgi:hypothetical protein